MNLCFLLARSCYAAGLAVTWYRGSFREHAEQSDKTAYKQEENQ